MNERFDELRINLRAVQEKIEKAASAAGREPDEITLIAVTKFFPLSDVRALYDLGIRNFGENRDEEGAQKAGELASDALWHFQGQIQGRKIPSLLEWADYIHSLDSLDHATKCERRLAEMGESRAFFIQINLEPERTDRGGITLSQLPEFISAVRELRHLQVSGLMTVPPVDADPARSFAQIAAAADLVGVEGLSMGMSGDFEAAICAGATHIRVGSSILGSRPTPT